MKSITLFPSGANSYTIEGGLYERGKGKLYKPEQSLFAKEFKFRHIEIRTLTT